MGEVRRAERQRHLIVAVAVPIAHTLLKLGHLSLHLQESRLSELLLWLRLGLGLRLGRGAAGRADRRRQLLEWRGVCVGRLAFGAALGLGLRVRELSLRNRDGLPRGGDGLLPGELLRFARARGATSGNLRVARGN